MMSTQQLSDQTRNRELVEAAVAAGGYTVAGFYSNKDLEVYFEIATGGRDVGFIAKGWTDPGFRIGQIVTVPHESLEDSEPPEYLREFCATSGITLLRPADSEGEDWSLEYVIYSSGFNAEALREAISTLIECTERVKQDLRCRFVGALFGSRISTGSLPLPA